VTYLEGRCLSYGSTIPYHPIVDIICDNCGIMETDRPDAIIEKVGAALNEVGMESQASAPYFLQLLGVKEGAVSIASLTPEAIKTRTFDTLKQMSLLGSRQRPLIFAIEDLHWLDGGTYPGGPRAGGTPGRYDRARYHSGYADGTH
jgi:predicted ATPase